MLGCEKEKHSEVVSDQVESTKNSSLNEDVCKELLNSYFEQQFAFDNTKMHELNSHIVSITSIEDREFSNFLAGKTGSQSPLSELILDRTTDREVLRDYICHKFIIPTVALGTWNSNYYKKIFTRLEGNEIADWYVNLYSLTKFDIQKDDSVQDKNKYVDAFKNFIKDVDSNEIYFFKISIEHIDFNSINNKIAARLINDFIKDKKIIISNERIKNRKTDPPTKLDAFWNLIPISSNAMPSGNDIQYIRDKTKQIFIDVLKDNVNSPKFVKDDFYVCMYGKPLLENTQKIFLVSPISDTINKPSETPSPTGGVIHSDKTINTRPFISNDLNAYIWKNFVGNISKTQENIFFKSPPRAKPIGPSFTILSTKPVDGSDKNYKYYRLNILLSNDTSKELDVDTNKFDILDSYDDFVGTIDNEGSKEWIKLRNSGNIVGYIYKSDYDKLSDDELDMLIGAKSIPPQKTLEFTKIIRLQKDKLTSNDVWLTFRNFPNNYQWEAKLEVNKP